jgi:hypothetical protein
MKLRFRKNSLRLRLNRKEVAALAENKSLRESIAFPGGDSFSYQVSTAKSTSASATFLAGIISVALPADSVREWSTSDEIGLYYKLDTAAGTLDIAVEKDLECIDAPEEERDPFAYSRKAAC